MTSASSDCYWLFVGDDYCCASLT